MPAGCWVILLPGCLRSGVSSADVPECGSRGLTFDPMFNLRRAVNEEGKQPAADGIGFVIHLLHPARSFVERATSPRQRREFSPIHLVRTREEAAYNGMASSSSL